MSEMNEKLPVGIATDFNENKVLLYRLGKNPKIINILFTLSTSQVTTLIIKLQNSVKGLNND